MKLKEEVRQEYLKENSLIPANLNERLEHFLLLNKVLKLERPTPRHCFLQFVCNDCISHKLQNIMIPTKLSDGRVITNEGEVGRFYTLDQINSKRYNDDLDIHTKRNKELIKVRRAQRTVKEES